MDYVFIHDLASEIGMHHSNLNKYAIKHGITPLKVRNPNTWNHQVGLAFSLEDADKLRKIRFDEGFSSTKQVVVDVDNGYFYIIQLIPEFDSNRVKLGFTNDIQGRLMSHKASAPTAILVKHWQCKRLWEPVAITSVTRIECKHILNEVYECENLDSLVERCERFFEIMPI